MYSEGLAAAAIKWRYVCILLSSCFVAALVALTPDAKVETDFEIYFESDDPDLVAFQAITEDFPRETNVVLLVRSLSGQTLNADAYRVAKAITDFASADPDVDRVASATEFELLRTENDDIITQRVVPDQQPYDADTITQALLNDPDAVGRVISKDGRFLAIAARFFKKPGNAAGLVDATERYRTFAQELEATHPGIDVLVSGLIPLEATLYEIMISDSAKLVPLLFAVVIALMIVFIGSAVGILGTLLVATVSALCSLIAIPWLGFGFNDVNVSAVLVVVTIASADCIHVLVRFFAERRKSGTGDDPHGLIVSAITHVLPPIGLTTLTTMIGFGLFRFAEAPPIKQFGVVSAIGVGFAFLFTLCVFVPLLAIFPPQRSTVPRIHNLVGNTLTRIKDRLKSRAAWRAAILLCLGVGAFSLGNQIDDDIVEYVSDKTDVRTAVNLSQGQLNGLQFIDIVLATPSDDSILQPRIMQAIEDLSDWLHTQPVVTGVDSLTSQLKRVQAAIDGQPASVTELPHTENGLSEILFLLEIVSKPGALNDTVNFVRTQTKLRAYVGDESARTLLQLDQKIKEKVSTLDLPGSVKLTTTGPTLMFALLGQKNIVSVLWGTLTFLAVVTLVLSAAFRSWRMGVLSIVPNLFPVLLVFGIWYFVNGTLNLAGITVITAILGLVVDDTIHIMWNYQRADAADKASGKAIFVDLAPALTTTSACFSLGFAILLFSAFTPTQTMGALVALAIACAYLFDLIMLPRLLAATDTATEPNQ